MRGFRVGKVAGLDLEVPPLFGIWGILLWRSMADVFAHTYLGFPERTYPCLALGATLLLLASLLWHDWLVVNIMRWLGCSLPDRLVLFPWGGLGIRSFEQGNPLLGSPKNLSAATARCEDELGGALEGAGESRGNGLTAELLAGFAGPAAYIVSALAYLYIGVVFAPLAPAFLPVRGVTDTLAAANAILAFVNLIPALPLDAGRVASVLVNLRSADPVRGVSAARFGGHLAGMFSIGLGGFLLLGSDGNWGLWAVWALVLGTGMLSILQRPSLPQSSGYLP